MPSRTAGMWWGAAIEAPDAAAPARFYSELLGWPIGHEEPGTAIVAAAQGPIYLVFQQATDYRPPVWPPVEGAQRPMMHLDFQVGDLAVFQKLSDIPPPPPGRKYTISTGCVDGNWRVRARAEGLSPDGTPFSFSLPVEESLIRVVRCRLPRPGRNVLVRVEPGPDGMKLLTVRECWPATGLETDPLYSCEYSGFTDEADMLRQVSSWFGLAEDGWTTVTPHTEYRHG